MPLSRAALQSLSRPPRCMGVAAPGVATGTALHRMEELAQQVLPPGIGFEWTEIAFQQQQKGTPTVLVFGAAALFVFLVLAAQYESWKLPLAVVLIVPMCLLASVTRPAVPRHADRHPGADRLRGAGRPGGEERDPDRRVRAPGAGGGQQRRRRPRCSAARTRLRPILMTSLAFILGVAPLVVATGAGAEMRQSLGTAVFAGMLGRHRLRPDLHAGLLHPGAADQLRPRPSGSGSSRAADAGPQRRRCNRSDAVTNRPLRFRSAEVFEQLAYESTSAGSRTLHVRQRRHASSAACAEPAPLRGSLSGAGALRPHPARAARAAQVLQVAMGEGHPPLPVLLSRRPL